MKYIYKVLYQNMADYFTYQNTNTKELTKKYTT